MKLTESQRLLIKAGEALAREKEYRFMYKVMCDEYSQFDRERLGESIADTKSKRKKLIRKAMKAYENESHDIYIKGYRAALWDE